jgi:sugar phosphate isomerase/epimerase
MTKYKDRCLRIGLSNSLFRGESLEFILKLISYLGIEWLEIKTELLEENMERAVTILQDIPVKHISVHASYQNINFANITKQQVAIHKRDIDFAQIIGSDRIVFHAGYASDFTTKESLVRIIPVVQHYLDYSNDSQIKILLENAGCKRNKILSSPAQLLYVLDSIRHPRLGVTFDVFNFLKVPKKCQKKYYGKLSSWIRHVHLNSVPVSRGDFELKEYVKYVLSKLKIKKRLKKAIKNNIQIPIILEGKTSLLKEMFLYSEMRRSVLQ